MLVLEILLGLYVTVALLSAAMTLRERGAHEPVTWGDRLLGCLACTVWPLVFAAVAVEAQRRMPPQRPGR